METLEALAVRCESTAAVQQCDLIGDAWDALGPTVRWTAVQAGRFGKMMDAGAFESVAMLMVPDNHGYAIWSVIGKKPSAAIQNPDDGWQDWCQGSTVALALCSAALRAHLLAQKDHTPS